MQPFGIMCKMCLVVRFLYVCLSVAHSQPLSHTHSYIRVDGMGWKMQYKNNLPSHGHSIFNMNLATDNRQKEHTHTHTLYVLSLALHIQICCVQLHRPVDDDDNLTNYYESKKQQLGEKNDYSSTCTMHMIRFQRILMHRIVKLYENCACSDTQQHNIWLVCWSVCWFTLPLHHIAASTMNIQSIYVHNCNCFWVLLIIKYALKYE